MVITTEVILRGGWESYIRDVPSGSIAEDFGGFICPCCDIGEISVFSPELPFKLSEPHQLVMIMARLNSTG